MSQKASYVGFLSEKAHEHLHIISVKIYYLIKSSTSNHARPPHKETKDEYLGSKKHLNTYEEVQFYTLTGTEISCKPKHKKITLFTLRTKS